MNSKRFRIAGVNAEFTQDCDTIVEKGFHDWQQRLREDGGAEIVAFDSAFWEDAMSIYAPIQASEAAAIHAPATSGDFSHFEKSIAERLSCGAALSVRELAAFRARHATFRDRMDVLLREHDFLIAPCAPVSRLAAQHPLARASRGSGAMEPHIFSPTGVRFVAFRYDSPV